MITYASLNDLTVIRINDSIMLLVVNKGYIKAVHTFRTTKKNINIAIETEIEYGNSDFCYSIYKIYAKKTKVIENEDLRILMEFVKENFVNLMELRTDGGI